MRKSESNTKVRVAPETSPAAPAAVGAVPATTAAGVTPTHATDHPDRELLDLVAEYHRLQAIEAAKGRI